MAFDVPADFDLHSGMFEWIYVDACNLYTEVPCHGFMINIIKPSEFNKGPCSSQVLKDLFNPRSKKEVDLA